MSALKVKLVIWDLDETLWTGTLSEGEVICSNGHIVKELCEHGIVNSISSKNDFEKAKSKLKEFGLWEYFIFPSINWNPKGEAVKKIIEDCQLRAQNVVFVDDNPSNLKEVEFYNPEIITVSSVADLQKLIRLDDYKEDLFLNRLAQYKILEKKKEYKDNFCTSNIEFLIKSNIRIEFISNLNPIKERLVEMIGRTNQLNYTKLRIGLDDMESLIADDAYECKAIRVIDDFGDYGICGFYAYNKLTHSLLHFLFSCRILNLGVENYVYQKIGKPSINIIKPVSIPLDSVPITWISEICSHVKTEKNTDSFLKKTRILLLGGCDLDQLCHYIGTNSYEIIKDFNYPNQQQYPVHREHTVYLKKVEKISDKEFLIISKLPFLDENFLNYNFISRDFDYLIYSPLMNYTQELYRHKQFGFKIAVGGYNNILNCNNLDGFTESQLAGFKKDYEFLGQQTPEDFKKDLEWLLLEVQKPIIFLNGAECDIDNPNEVGAKERHKVMNKALQDFVEIHSDKCQVVDVNKFVKSRTDLLDNIRHYKRSIYVSLANEIIRKTTGGKVNKITAIKYMIYRVIPSFLKGLLKHI